MFWGVDMATNHSNGRSGHLPTGPSDSPGRRITEDDAEAIAHHVVDSLMGRLTDEETVETLISVWRNQLDKSIGRSVRRLIFWFLGTLVLVAAFQMEKFVAFVARLLGR